jgi:hydrogenase/urease accessory protein HupE
MVPRATDKSFLLLFFKKEVLCFLSLIFLFAASAQAHESRPGYLELTQASADHFDVLWKQPANGEYALRMGPLFPPSCTVGAARDADLLPGALLSRFSVTCPGGLDGKSITIAGLEMTLTDVLVRVHRLDGTQETHLVRATDTSVTIGGGGGLAGRAMIYLRLGIQHILMGIDHLLFVLGLLLIVRDTWTLLKTISAFTLAHSITLAAATFGVASVPAPPLNAAIALSILFLGPEIMRARAGGTSLTIRKPWLVAFAFGLLHGFGFASGLVSMGLPHAEIPMALLLFNVGVEIGQLAFVLLILGLERAFRLMEMRWPKPVALLPAYTVGVLGAFWTLQRLMIFLGQAA